MAKKFFGAEMKTVTRFFLDRERVIRQMDNRTRRAFNYIGGTLRKTAQRSIRKPGKKKPYSEPGKPVKSRSGKYKRTIFYEYEPKNRSLICGPKKLPIRTSVRPGSRRTIPELLEYGGTGRAIRPTYVALPKRKRKGVKLKDQRRQFKKLPPGPRRYKARPTMRLAQKKTVTNPRLQRAYSQIRS